ncbi:DNA polymerase III subunit beta [Candidatus Azambacteria bacterium RIFCSPHIGHO2_01_FULL_40_24]|uniref:Beta sliding clamp n=1 Tax=Candidatus Azambacteria bacterium RIFCSPHIGHO2_01_FULL_40_24 TaxID=1797301 RepID=A0A1F5B4P3_9BACT|nr:MAG: DNA polymerase III subunit beta [Candidatus Azambacteria bacterium RIFCSPHIGHO2_01_FULL_40_24]
MNFICFKENLKKKLDNALRIIKYNSTLPILNNFLLSTEKGMLKISSTDLEIGFTSLISSKILKDGSITVPAQLLSQFINNLPNKNINFEVKDFKLYLNCDNIKASINGLNAEDFPIIPKVKNDSILTINSKLFKNSLNSVINSSAISDARPEISSIYIKINPDQIKFVATDSFRLAHKTIFVLSGDNKEKIKINFEKSRNIILPLRTAGELTRILGEQDNDVKIMIDQNQILFDFDDTQLISRLVEGNYPDYEAIIPKSSETKCYLNKNDLEESIKLSGCFSSKLNDITIKTNSEKSQIEIFSNNVEYGNHHAKINSEIKGKDVSIVFNWHYFLDGLKNINEDELILEFNGDQKPAVIKSAKNNDFFYILMPIRNS